MSNEEQNGFFAKPVLGNVSDLFPQMSFLETVQNEFIRKASKDFDNHLKNYVTKNIKELGFEFQSEDDFIQFISKRVTKIAFEDKPNEYELYVDYQTDNQKLIGIYNDKVSFSYEGNKVTATFGRNIA